MLKKKLDILSIAVIFSGIFFLIWKAPFGYIFNDEPFILTLAHRLTFGDALLVNEWNLTQLTSFITYPILLIFRQFNPTNEGVILSFRYFYIIMWSITCIIIFLKIRKIGKYAALFVYCYLILFAPLDQMTLSYNSIGLAGFLLALSILATESKIWHYFICGSIYALAVLNSPFTILTYFLYSLVVLIYWVFKHKANSLSPKSLVRIFNIKTWLWFTLGAFLIAMVFSLFVLSRASISSVLLSVRIMLNQRSSISLFYKISMYFASLEKVFSLIINFGIPILLISIIDSKRIAHRLFYLLVQIGFWIIVMVKLNFNYFGQFNYLMTPLVLLGLQAFILTKSKRYDVFVLFWLFGLIYSTTAHYGSDTNAMAISMSFTVSGVGSVILLHDLISELLIDRDKPNKFRLLYIFKRVVLPIICITIFSIQIGSEINIKLHRNYWDGDSKLLNTEIRFGPAKGIKTTPELNSLYSMVYKDLLYVKTLVTNANKRVLITSLIPWAYLELDLPYGTFSAWTYYQNDINYENLFSQLDRYYTLNPSYIADIVYTLKDDSDSQKYLESFFGKTDYQWIETDIAYVLVRY